MPKQDNRKPAQTGCSVSYTHLDVYKRQYLHRVLIYEKYCMDALSTCLKKAISLRPEYILDYE